MSSTEVTNSQFEQFAPAHKKFRGKNKLSVGDDDAVNFVSWDEAVRFCKWLSKKEGKSYRLPTEAEWEYACRARTTSDYFFGKRLPNALLNPLKKSLKVGTSRANAWGLFDIHGNVEEWCHDWYGPYASEVQVDPVGRVDGDFKVTRGGSLATDAYFLRSANRLGTLPKDKHWLIGFRIVLGELPKSKPLPVPDPHRWANNVNQRRHDWKKRPNPKQPYFKGPVPFVHIPPNSNGPMFSRHNHQPALTVCPNGDLLAVWYSLSKRARSRACCCRFTLAERKKQMGSRCSFLGCTR